MFLRECGGCWRRKPIAQMESVFGKGPYCVACRRFMVGKNTKGKR
jgi:hypothetical protein